VFVRKTFLSKKDQPKKIAFVSKEKRDISLEE
jgi:hypothetical protein